MSKNNIYLVALKDVEVTSDDVFVKDVAKIYCSDTAVTEKIKAVKIFTFDKEAAKNLKKTEIDRQVISILKIIELIETAYPGAAISSLGEADVLVEKKQKNKHKQPVKFLKIITASGVCFFGTAFTIMAFHNDVAINTIFGRMYEMIMGQPATGYTIMEVAYSVGLALGIILFFNHVGGRRITKDPTPIEVAMRNYEDDVNKSLVATAEREEKIMNPK